MADPKVMLEVLIEENAGELVRKRKHKVYRFPNGATFVVASTPECPFAYDNALAHLKRLLGITPPDRGAPGTRRHKRLKIKAPGVAPFEPVLKESVETWKDKLQATIKCTPLPVAVVTRRPHVPTFEEQMIRTGVRKLEQR